MLVIVNVYFPVNDGTVSSRVNLNDTLRGIRRAAGSQPFNYLLVAGDFNTDISHKTTFSKALLDFADYHFLVLADVQFQFGDSVGWTFETHSGLSHSWIDHVLVSSRIASAVSEVSTLDHVSNFSDHRPLLAVCQLHLAELITHTDRPTQRKISIVWNKASNEDLQRYSELVNHRLQDISLSDDIVHCTEPFCHKHQHDLDTHCKAICDCLVQSANICIPDNSHHKCVAGWNEPACFLKH